MRYELEITGPLTIDARMRSSDLEVTASEGTAQAVVIVTPRRGGEEAVAATRVEMVGDRLVIEAPKSSGSLFRSSLAVRVQVEVPPGTSLDSDTGSGDLRTRGPLARVSVRNGSGDVVLERAEQASVTTGSGDVTLDEAAAATVHAGSGDVRIGQVSRAEIRTGSGDVRVESAADLGLSTGSGDGVVGAVTGSVRLASGSGDLVVGTATSGEIHGKAASGDVVVGIARGTAALLDCSSISGRVTSDLEQAGEPGEGEQGVVLRLRTVSGDIKVRRS